MAKKKTCKCCLKEYEFCPNCSNRNNYPAWKNEFDEESCSEIFNIISAYNMGIVKPEDVKAVIDKYNITDFSKYKKSIRDKLIEATEALSKEEPKEETKVEDIKIEEPKVEEIKMEESKTEESQVDDVKPEIKSVAKPQFKENKFNKNKFGNK